MSRRFRFDEYEADFAAGELRKLGKRVSLQHKPFRVLELLLQRPGELVRREELVTFLWPDSHVSFERGLNTAVNSLRQALGESSRKARFIETRPGIGYRFCAPVQEVAERARTVKDYGGAAANVSEDYLKGRYCLDRMSEEDSYKAIAFFTSAAADKNCASYAHAGIADAYCQLAMLGSAGVSKLAPQARSSADAALRENPDLAEAHASAARVRMIFDWDWEGAEESIERALTLDPSSGQVHALRSSLLCTLSCYEEAQQACQRALSLDQLSFSINLRLAACLYGAGHFEAASEQCWKILILAPNFPPAQLVLALAYEQLEMFDEALVEFRNAQTCAGFKPQAISGMGHLFATNGFHSEAELAFVELSEQAKTRHVSSYWHAPICAGRKQDGEALTFLEQAFRERDPAMLSLSADRRFHALQNFERFRILLNRLTNPLARYLD